VRRNLQNVSIQGRQTRGSVNKCIALVKPGGSTGGF